MYNGNNIPVTNSIKLEKINNMDYIAIVNTVDLLTNQAIYIEYPMVGNGMSFPKQTSEGLHGLMNILKFKENNQGRVAIDVTTLIDYNGLVIWDSLGLTGYVGLK